MQPRELLDKVVEAVQSTNLSQNLIPNLSVAQHIRKLYAHRRGAQGTTLLQKFCVFYYCWSFMYWLWCWVATTILCIYFPFLIPLVMVYTYYIIYGKGALAAVDASWPTPMRDWCLWKQCVDYFGAKLHKTIDLPPGQPYIFGFHPHGIVAFGGFLSFGTRAMGFHKLFPGIDIRVLTLRINFQAPFLREYLLLHGTCCVDKEACLNILNRNKSIFIAIGGGKESLCSKPRSADLVLQRRQGFVKIALQSGASLVPCFSFGETDTFRTLNELPENSSLRRAQRFLLKYTGFTLPFVYGVGFFLPWGLLPYPIPINVVIGAPIKVPKYQGDLQSAEFATLVDKYHSLYINALQTLYDDNKEKYAKGVEMKIVQ